MAGNQLSDLEIVLIIPEWVIHGASNLHSANIVTDRKLPEHLRWQSAVTHALWWQTSHCSHLQKPDEEDKSQNKEKGKINIHMAFIIFQVLVADQGEGEVGVGGNIHQLREISC